MTWRALRSIVERRRENRGCKTQIREMFSRSSEKFRAYPTGEQVRQPLCQFRDWESRRFAASSGCHRRRSVVKKFPNGA